MARQRLLLISVILIGLLLRWYNLDVRPMHHDESLHVMYSYYYFENPSTGFYRYNPMLHGPVLYHVLPLFYSLLDVSIWSARSLTALLGSLLLLGPLVFRRQLSKGAILGLTAVIALSPTLTYWSRFIRHDYLVIFSMLLCVFATCVRNPRIAIVLFLVGAVLQLCIKENAYVTTAILIGFLFFEALYIKLCGGTQRSYLIQAVHKIRENLFFVFFACLIGVAIYFYFYTAGFRYFGPVDGSFLEQNFGTVLDGLYRKSVAYWAEHHNQERIRGPFLFQVYVLGWYEIGFILALLFQLLFINSEATKAIRIGFISSGVFAVSLYLYYSSYGFTDSSLWSFFKVKNTLDIAGVFLLFSYSLLLSLHHTQRGEQKLAFWGYFFSANLFTYSFLGEKVPWLALYPYSSGLIYLTLYFDNTQQFKRIASRRYIVIPFLLLLLLSLHSNILTNFSYAGRSNEIIGQVHTTYEFQNAVELVQAQIDESANQPPLVLGLGNAIWPLSTYMIGYPSYRFATPSRNLSPFAFIFTSHTKEAYQAIPTGYQIESIPLRAWWVPDYDEMTLGKFLTYTVYHKPWNKTGHLNIYFARKPSSE